MRAEFLLFRVFLLTVLGWMHREQQGLIAYLLEEHRVLREQTWETAGAYAMLSSAEYLFLAGMHVRSPSIRPGSQQERQRSGQLGVRLNICTPWRSAQDHSEIT